MSISNDLTLRTRLRANKIAIVHSVNDTYQGLSSEEMTTSIIDNAFLAVLNLDDELISGLTIGTESSITALSLCRPELFNRRYLEQCVNDYNIIDIVTNNQLDISCDDHLDVLLESCGVEVSFYNELVTELPQFKLSDIDIYKMETTLRNIYNALGHDMFWKSIFVTNVDSGLTYCAYDMRDIHINTPHDKLISRLTEVSPIADVYECLIYFIMVASIAGIPNVKERLIKEALNYIESISERKSEEHLKQMIMEEASHL